MQYYDTLTVESLYWPEVGTNMFLHALEQVVCEYVCFGRDGNIGIGYSM